MHRAIERDRQRCFRVSSGQLAIYSKRRRDRPEWRSWAAPAERSSLHQSRNLYSQWDADKGQPLLANEVARQIWYILDTAIAQYYPNVQNIVLVGGDNTIPFFRVPDETQIANEGDYYSQLNANGALQHQRRRGE